MMTSSEALIELAPRLREATERGLSAVLIADFLQQNGLTVGKRKSSAQYVHRQEPQTRPDLNHDRTVE